MKAYYIGVDIGGTSVKLGSFETDGTLIEKWEIPTRKEKNGQLILPDVANSIQKEMKKEDTHIIKGIGVGVPGPVTEEGVVLKCANLGWDVFSVKEKVMQLTGVNHVKIGNDANVAGLGEMWKGGGRGYRSIVMVTLGTGVGGGIIINEKILNGINGAAGEIGHMRVEPEETDICGCGGRGCLEQYASATGIVRLAKKKIRKTSCLYGKDISAKLVFDGAKAGDVYCQEVVETFGKYLGTALASVSCVVDSEAIVIGGGVSRAGQIILDVVSKWYNEKALFALKNKKFCLAELGNDAGIYGCAKMVIE